MAKQDPVAVRGKFVEGWNKMMVDIWLERIKLLDVYDTGALMNSVISMPVRHDGRYYDMTLSHSFIEYGLWQDLGVGREVPIGNPGDIGRDKVRERRRWFSVKYYSSVMRLRDFLGMSLGEEFKAMFINALDADRARHSTNYYKRKGL